MRQKPGTLKPSAEKVVKDIRRRSRNHRRCHESLGNVTPADVHFGRDQAILSERRRIKKETIRQRRLLNQMHAA